MGTIYIDKSKKKIILGDLIKINNKDTRKNRIFIVNLSMHNIFLKKTVHKITEMNNRSVICTLTVK